MNELESLINLGAVYSFSWLGTQGFTNVQDARYWTSTTLSCDAEKAWCIFSNWDDASPGLKAESRYVWPVRSVPNDSYPAPPWKTGQTISYYQGDDGDLQKGVAWPNPRFTSHDGTVTDNLTGLMWTKNTQQFSDYGAQWQSALDSVKEMNAGNYPNFGYTDWRLPNRKELCSLIDYSRCNPALPSDHPFLHVKNPNPLSDFRFEYWSSTTLSPMTAFARNISIYDGATSNGGKTNLDFVWLVRGGLAEASGCSSWNDVKAKYQAYKNGQATLGDVIDCYREWRGNGTDQ